MIQNYLNPYLSNLFNEIGFLDSNLYVLDSFIKQRQKKINLDFPYETELMMSASYIRDLSLIGPGTNLFPTGFDYELNTSNMADEVDRLLSHICCLSIAQAYEVMESFLKDCVSSFCSVNNANIMLGIDEDLTTFESIRLTLDHIKEPNYKGYLKLLRKASISYSKVEINNYRHINLSLWLKVMTKVRHDIVHNRQRPKTYHIQWSMLAVRRSSTFSLKSELITT